MKLNIFLSLFLLSALVSNTYAQKIKKSQSDIITIVKIKLSDEKYQTTKYDMSKYYTVNKNILIPAKGMQMVYSRKYGQFFILAEDTNVGDEVLQSMYDKGDTKDLGNDREFGCMGCRRDSRCVPTDSMDGSTTYCGNPCRSCQGFVTTKKDDAREFETANGDWRPIEELF